MKKVKLHSMFLALAAVAHIANAATTDKLNNNTALDQAGSWSNGVPTSADTARWTGSVSTTSSIGGNGTLPPSFGGTVTMGNIEADSSGNNIINANGLSTLRILTTTQSNFIIKSGDDYTIAPTKTTGVISVSNGALTINPRFLVYTTNNTQGDVVVNVESLLNFSSNNTAIANSFHKLGNGTVTMQRMNAGILHLYEGVWQTSSILNGGLTSGLGNNSNDSYRLQLTGGTLQYVGNATSTDRAFRLLGNFTFDASGNGTLYWGTGTKAMDYGVATNVDRTLTLSGNNTGDNTMNTTLIDNGTGKLSLTKSGVGTWVLSANNTHSGVTLVEGGTLAIGNVKALQNSTLDTGASGSQATTFTVAGTNTYLIGGLQGFDTLDIGGNTINVGANNVSTVYNGILSGASGSLVKTGSASLALSSANTYSGGTAINAGTLWAQAPQSLGTGEVDINGGTMLVSSAQSMGGNLQVASDINWNSGTIAYYSNASSSPATDALKIDVVGNLVASVGNKTFDFSQVAALDVGVYTLVNATAVSAVGATFVAAHGQYTQLFGNFTTTSNSVLYNVTGATSFGPTIQNVGGPNTPLFADYNVSQDTATVGATNRINSLAFTNNNKLFIAANGALTVASGTLGVQNGSSVISGGTLNTPGNFYKTGSGELNLQSKTNVSGIATVMQGLLSVNEQFTASEVVVNPLATLGGSGRIIGNVAVRGTLAPGNSPGTLTVNGNLALAKGSSTIIEIASPTNFDRIVVSGQASLGGTLRAVAYGGSTITPGTRYDFLQAGSITGAFDSIIVPEGLRARFLNSGTTGSLLFGPGSFIPYALTANQRQVAKALDRFILATEGDALTVGIALDSLTPEQFPHAFEQIMPGFYESLADMSIEQAFTQTQQINQRLGAVRTGVGSFQAIGMRNEPLKHDRDGKSVADAKTSSPLAEDSVSKNWNSWVMGTGSFSRAYNLSEAPGYQNDAGGFLAGADYRWSEAFSTGLYAGYQYNYAKYSGGSSTRGNSALFGAYATWQNEDGYYVNSVVGGGYTGYQTRRTIDFGTIDRTARANPDSGQFSAALNLGKDFELGNWTLGPIIGTQYTYAGVGGFAETGADSLDLALGQQNASSLRSTLGGRIAYTWEVAEKIALIPEARMLWMHEFLNNPRTINSALEGGSGPSFGYETSDPYRNSVYAGAGLTAQIGQDWSASVFYNVNFGAQTYLENAISASLNFAF